MKFGEIATEAKKQAYRDAHPINPHCLSDRHAACTGENVEWGYGKWPCECSCHEKKEN